MQGVEINMEKQVSHLPIVKSCDRARKENGSCYVPVFETQPSRKPVPQKEKALDKRPKERGSRLSSDVCEVTGSKGKSKKRNLNHLLNFTYDGSSADLSHWRRRDEQHWQKQHRQRFSKEQYLQANCQFVVSDGGDYTALTADADYVVDWSLIEQLRIYDTDIPSCPICLYPPVVARITRCGHVYCWTCILHFLSLADKSFCRCPICFHEVMEKDLKSVKSASSHKYKVGEQITMTLMRRERGSTYIQTKSAWSANDRKERGTGLHYISDDHEAESRFLKFVLARSSDVQAIICSERSLLQKQLQDCGGEQNLEGAYVISALRLLAEKEVQLAHSCMTMADHQAKERSCCISGRPVDPCTPVGVTTRCGGAPESLTKGTEGVDGECSRASSGARPCESQAYLDSLEADAESILADVSATPSGSGQSTRDTGSRSRANVITDVYYFYQSSDGQHIYLHSLNARCLAKEYGSLEAAPETISARIVEIEVMTMTEEVRKRLRYLSHVPLTCQFMIVELALEPPSVSISTLKMFDEEIKRRQRARNKKVRIENELTKRAELEEERILGRFPDLAFPLRSESHFPVVEPYPPNNTATAVSSKEPVNGSCSTEPAGISKTFAQTLLADGARSHSLGSQRSQASSSASKALPFPGSLGSKGLPAITTDVNDDEMTAPHYQTTFGDAIQAALSNLALTAGDQADDTGERASGGKKKKKQKLLFSTTIARAKP